MTNHDQRFGLADVHRNAGVFGSFARGNLTGNQPGVDGLPEHFDLSFSARIMGQQGGWFGPCSTFFIQPWTAFEMAYRTVSLRLEHDLDRIDWLDRQLKSLGELFECKLVCDDVVDWNLTLDHHLHGQGITVGSQV